MSRSSYFEITIGLLNAVYENLDLDLEFNTIHEVYTISMRRKTAPNNSTLYLDLDVDRGRN